MQEEEVDVLIPTAQYETIHTPTCKFFGSSKSISRCVIFEYGAILFLYSIKNE